MKNSPINWNNRIKSIWKMKINGKQTVKVKASTMTWIQWSLDWEGLWWKSTSKNYKSSRSRWTRKSFSLLSCRTTLMVYFDKVIEIKKSWRSKPRTLKSSKEMLQSCKRKIWLYKTNKGTCKSSSSLQIVVEELAKPIQETRWPVKGLALDQTCSDIALRGPSTWQVGRRS